MRPLAFKLLPWEFLEFFQKSLKSVKNLNFAIWKKVFSIKLRKIEHSAFFLLDHNGQNQVYTLVWGPTEVRFRRNHDFPTVEYNNAPPLGKLGLIWLQKGQAWQKLHWQLSPGPSFYIWSSVPNFRPMVYFFLLDFVGVCSSSSFSSCARGKTKLTSSLKT